MYFCDCPLLKIATTINFHPKSHVCQALGIALYGNGIIMLLFNFLLFEIKINYVSLIKYFVYSTLFTYGVHVDTVGKLLFVCNS